MSIRRLPPLRQLYNAVEALHDTRRMLAGMVASRAAERDAARGEGERLEVRLAALEARLEGVGEQLARVADRPAPAQAAPADIAIHDRLGFRLLLDRQSTIDRVLIDGDGWEDEQVAYFAGLLQRLQGRDGAIFLDVGAYWGLYTLLAHRSGAFAALYAIEADPHNFAQLQANLFLNDAARTVRCVNKAASSDDRPLLFRDSRSHPDGNRGGTSVLPHDTALPHATVPATSIDALLAGVDGTRDVLMKIDVEGFEAYVLEGMAETVQRHRVIAQVEIFDLHAAPAMAQIQRLGLVEIHRQYPDYWFTNHPDFLPAAG